MNTRSVLNEINPKHPSPYVQTFGSVVNNDGSNARVSTACVEQRVFLIYFLNINNINIYFLFSLTEKEKKRPLAFASRFHVEI